MSDNPNQGIEDRHNEWGQTEEQRAIFDASTAVITGKRERDPLTGRTIEFITMEQHDKDKEQALAEQEKRIRAEYEHN